MSFIQKHVSHLCKEILKVSGKKIRSLFVLLHLYKNLSENELIRFWPLDDVITILAWPSPTKITPPPHTLSPESPPRAPLCSLSPNSLQRGVGSGSLFQVKDRESALLKQGWNRGVYGMLLQCMICLVFRTKHFRHMFCIYLRPIIYWWKTV